MGSTGACPDGPSHAPAPLRWAGIVLVVEGLAMAALGVLVVGKALSGSPSSVGFAIVAGLLAAGTGLVLLLLARAVRRCRAWAFVPVIVLQGVALPVGYSLAVQAGLWQYGGPVLLLALSELFLLVAPSSRRAIGPGSER